MTETATQRIETAAERMGERAREVTERVSGPVERFMHQPALQRVWEAMERVPDGVYYSAILASILGSLGFFAAGKRHTALFIGQWAPTFATLALMNKLLRPSEG